MFLTPGWVGLTLLAWGLAAAMVLLGRWQLHVSDDKHFDIQNFGYAIQWWVFTAFALLFWAKLVRDAWRGGSTAGTSSSGQLVRANGSAVAPVGPVELRVPPDVSGREPVVYRAYRMPQSATSPVRSHGDYVHDAYNDYLWALSMEDAVKLDVAAAEAADTGPAAAAPRAIVDAPSGLAGGPAVDPDPATSARPGEQAPRPAAP